MRIADRVGNAASVAAGIVVGVLAVASAMALWSARPRPPVARVESAPALQRPRLAIGTDSPAVRVTVFATVPCVECEAWWPALADLLQSHPDRLEIGFRHSPASVPPNSMGVPAALRAECAAVQIGFVRSIQLAGPPRRAGDATGDSLDMIVPDRQAFTRCARAPETLARLVLDGEIARGAGLNGGPIVLVNGWILRRPSTRSLDSAVTRQLSLSGAPFTPPRVVARQ